VHENAAGIEEQRPDPHPGTVPSRRRNGVRHARSQGRARMDALTCIREKKRLATAGCLLAENAERLEFTRADLGTGKRFANWSRTG
jgi:hypothetical protein